MIIYQAYNPFADAFYIGKTVKSLSHRQNQHYCDAALARNNSVFHKAIRKYGKEAFDWCVLHESECLEELNEAERHWISLVKKTGHRLYNLREGGDGGSVAGPDNHKYGCKLSDDVKAKISKRLSAYYASHPNPMLGLRGEKSPNYGRKHTAEAKKKISEGNSGQKRPSMSGAANPSARQIRCTTTGETFRTATDAAKKYSSDLSSIIKCCRGKVKSVNGRHFEYEMPGVFGWTAQ